MSLNETVSAERVHIAFFGKRNVGKSSLVNAVTGQSLAVVSPVKGTTTDPVQKAMELLPLGPVVIIDTPGYDDEGDLGALRVEKTNQVLNKTDIAVLVYDAAVGMSDEDRGLLEKLQARKLPVILAANKSDLLYGAAEDGGRGSFDSAALRSGRQERDPSAAGAIKVSAVTGEGIFELKERLAALAPKAKPKYILADLVKPGDVVVLVIPIDESAPKGRLILPQQQTLRELLDLHCVPLCCQVEEIPSVLKALQSPPALVVTDSQAFGKVSPLVPASIPLTSFSGLHPPSAVQRHRHREAPGLGAGLYQGGADLLLLLRRRVSGGFAGLRPGDPLRRLHAERGRHGAPDGRGQSRGGAHGELRRRHRGDARHPETQPGALCTKSFPKFIKKRC